MSELAAAADVVALGTVQAQRGSEIDDGGNPDGLELPMAFFDFSVERLLAGDAPRSWVVGVIDATMLSAEGVTTMQEGERVILFVRYFSDGESPGIETEGEFYLPLSADNGVFDVSDEQVTARSPVVRGIGLRDVGKEPMGEHAPGGATFATELDALIGGVVSLTGTRPWVAPTGR